MAVRKVQDVWDFSNHEETPPLINNSEASQEKAAFVSCDRFIYIRTLHCSRDTGPPVPPFSLEWDPPVLCIDLFAAAAVAVSLSYSRSVSHSGVVYQELGRRYTDIPFSLCQAACFSVLSCCSLLSVQFPV